MFVMVQLHRHLLALRRGLSPVAWIRRAFSLILRAARPSVDGWVLTAARAIAVSSLRSSNMLSMPPSTVLLTSTATRAIAVFSARVGCG